MAQHDALLVEIGTEELPPKLLKSLGEQFAQNLYAGLIDANFSPESYQWFASPRRLAILISRIADTQPDSEIEKRGPAVSAAFDEDGNPTKAALGWARGNGIDIADAQRLKTDKGEWLLHKAEIKGKGLESEIESLITAALNKLPIPKPMRWADFDHQFIRPVHTLCVMFGSQVIPASLFGISSSKTIRGHRFHGNATFDLTHATEYENTLINHYVVASFSRRVDTIKSALEKRANALNLIADYSTALLEEIASLVEWPKVMQASFEEKFLEVPKEALIYTMKDDQKYVPLLGDDGVLSNIFLFVSNIDSKNPDAVISGNEKVIRPRLADAEFFFNTDKKHSLESRIEKLETVLFQKRLGTLKDKAIRLQNLAGEIAEQTNADKTDAMRAGLLCKADLMSEMVMEFPEVQGVMGKYYAQHDGESEAVADAIEAQYLPRFAGDALPQSTVGLCVSLADKLDTLVGIFGIGQRPKGDKDPFALRRAAIGTLRLIVESQHNLDLTTLVETAAAQYPKGTLEDNTTDVVDFILTRFGAMLHDEGNANDTIQAVAIRRPTQPLDFVARVRALEAFRAHEAADALFAANKRVANILSKNKVDSDAAVNSALFELDQEKALHSHMVERQERLQHNVASRDYSASLEALAELRAPIDAFFDDVMVMADDDAVKQNRLALLSQLRAMFLSVADISVMAK
ncbi:glycine--tRNA ligase subunit beta [Alteromonas sediminis]|uniref:Glycine--tRNA ligase beta subunit n=1 Tax=Alteromonas sediminis TaxID=2259342 RepID=A0A3N5Y286_9ALTE|nr:glycine--tRNA ligase subunit beta [Alteromonas sediminis]RPJ66786.1 glycine--tRNA ligase subunit beta [Alteromonas sediminis]